ncbi:MAG: phosphoribosyltransferase family protein [Candidatus Nezhaarchaeota archaeon]|nr:phosphoribosyltransferase family protein [Candidatus Nezhaarchaeota archaeon]
MYLLRPRRLQVLFMKVVVKFAATLRPLASAPEREIEVEDGLTLSDLVRVVAKVESDRLVRRLLNGEELQSDILTLINGVEISALQGTSTRLKEGDEVVFLPSVHGGSVELEAVWWDDLYFKTMELARAIRLSKFKPDVIVGIARGGWVIARLLSDFLGNTNLASVKVEFYSDVAKHREVPSIAQPVSTHVEGLRVLVADDVADTGRSLEAVKRHLEERGALEVRIATVYYKPWSIVKPDYYVVETTKWIIFPHEVKETLVSLMRRWLKEGEGEEEVKRRLLEAKVPVKVLEALFSEALQEAKGGGK